MRRFFIKIYLKGQEEIETALLTPFRGQGDIRLFVSRENFASPETSFLSSPAEIYAGHRFFLSVA